CPWLTDNDNWRDYMYQLFSGRLTNLPQRGNWKITLDKTPIDSPQLQNDFLYLCKPADVPGDIKVKDYLSFFAAVKNVPQTTLDTILNSRPIEALKDKLFDQLKPGQRFDVVRKVIAVTQSKVILLNHIMEGMTQKHAIRLVSECDRASGSYVILLTDRNEPDPDRTQMEAGTDFADNDKWYHTTKELQLKHMADQMSRRNNNDG
ncbi:MAG: hypothetical protein GY765_18350, partial [bacterium]|nr:hypothetical protein [bacterium]